MRITERDLQLFIDEARTKKVITGTRIFPERFHELEGMGAHLYTNSVSELHGVFAYLVAFGDRRALLLSAGEERGEPLSCFQGFKGRIDSLALLLCPLTHENAVALRRFFPHTAPSLVLRNPVTFGVGDRLGLAGPGHISLFKGYRACPVLAQQSVREVELTRRSYEEVLDAATWAVFQEGYRGPWGADGDHLKTEEWVRRVLEIGFTMITADVSDFIRREFDGQPEGKIMSAYGAVDSGKRREAESVYLPMRVELDTGAAVSFNRGDLARLILIYGDAIDHAVRLYRAGVDAKGEGGFDFELSVDEVSTPTTAQAHVFVAKELARRGVRIASLAPKFVGEFQKGIDYIGDPEELARALEIHAAVARSLGHKVSVHSGSDKFTIFPAVGTCTRGTFHIKTSGTNWLCALKVIAAHDAGLFRDIFARARETFERARRHYHVTPDLDRVPEPASVPDERLPGLLDERNTRQVLHIAYGEILVDDRLRERFFDSLKSNIEAYHDELGAHIGRHLELLGVKRA